MADQPAGRPCEGCRMTCTGTKACTGCHAAWYCGHACQRAAWKKHKPVCRESAEDALARAASSLPYDSLDDEGVPRFPPDERTTREDNVLFDHFLASAKREPFYSHARELRDLVAAEDERERAENPRSSSSRIDPEEDHRTMIRLRSRYTELVREKGSVEQRQLWSRLCRDSREEFVARVLATPLSPARAPSSPPPQRSDSMQSEPMLQPDGQRRTKEMVDGTLMAGANASKAEADRDQDRNGAQARGSKVGDESTDHENIAPPIDLTDRCVVIAEGENNDEVLGGSIGGKGSDDTTGELFSDYAGREQIRSSEGGSEPVSLLLLPGVDDIVSAVLPFLTADEVMRCEVTSKTLRRMSRHYWDDADKGLALSCKSESAQDARSRVVRYQRASTLARNIGDDSDGQCQHCIAFPHFLKFPFRLETMDDYELFVRLSRTSDNIPFFEGFPQRFDRGDPSEFITLV